MLGLTFSFKLDLGSYIYYLYCYNRLQENWNLNLKFLSPDVALYLYKCTNYYLWDTVVTFRLVPQVAT